MFARAQITTILSTYRTCPTTEASLPTVAKYFYSFHHSKKNLTAFIDVIAKGFGPGPGMPMLQNLKP
jgi:hypothetical protein